MMQKKHCCKNMNFFLNENSVNIYYNKYFRRYSIGIKNGTSAVQTMYYCLWCGAQLPKILDDEWFDMIEEQYGVYDAHVLTIDENLKIPPEFKTEEWWKKRGL